MYNVLPARGRRRTFTLTALIAVAVAAGGTTIGLQAANGSTQLASTTQSVFSTTTQPVQAAEQDAQAVELGAVFHVTVPGNVVGIRYYKSAQNTGTHTAALWTSSGTLLTRATFSNETLQGWQTVTFAKPVSVKPGRNYVAGYHTNSGYYAQQQYAFSNGKTLGDGIVIETKGVYRYGPEGFPTQSWHDSSYYVDVIFAPAAPSSPTPSASSSLTTQKASGAGSSGTPTATPSISSGSGSGPSVAPTSGPTTSAPVPTSPVLPTASPSSPASGGTLGAPTSPSASFTPSSPPASSNLITPSPSSSPSASTSAMSNCWSRPSACGFPDGTNTGVQPGVALTSSGGLTITQDGAVVQNLLITGELDVFANNVTVRNVKIVATGGYHALYTGWNYHGIIIDHVEIDGRHLNPSVPGLVGSGFTATALNIHGTGDAIDVGDNVTVRDSWLHDLTVNSGDHTDGVQSTGSDNVLITHCTIDATLPNGGVANSALIIGADLSNMGTVNVTNSLLGGGNYTIYAGADPGYDSGVINFTGNRFARNARYGPCSFGPSPGRTIGFTNNVWDADGTPLVCTS